MLRHLVKVSEGHRGTGSACFLAHWLGAVAEPLSLPTAKCSPLNPLMLYRGSAAFPKTRSIHFAAKRVSLL